MSATALLRRSSHSEAAARREAAALADRVDDILREAARRPAPGLSARAPLHRDQIAAARPFLVSLGERLREAERPRPGGLAQTRELLTDGTGPIYAPAELGTLAARAWRAADAI